jgi:hypothetical protein
MLDYQIDLTFWDIYGGKVLGLNKGSGMLIFSEASLIFKYVEKFHKKSYLYSKFS